MATIPSRLALPHANLGVIGHSGHGKTTLVASLLRRLADRPDTFARPRAFEELVSGRSALTRCVVCLPADTPNRRWTLFDIPGHRQSLRAASSAMGCLDAAVLLVSAVDGVAPQTREHLLHARGLGDGQLLVFVNHCDRVDDPARIGAVEHDVRQILMQCGHVGDEVPFVRGAVRSKATWGGSPQSTG